MSGTRAIVISLVCSGAMFFASLAAARAADVEFSGTSYANRPVTLFIRGPETSETASPNPFLDYRVEVTFNKDELELRVPAYFCATKDAADSATAKGSLWQAHFIPPRAGQWTYEVTFRSGADIAVSSIGGQPAGSDGAKGKLQVQPHAGQDDAWSEGKLQLSRRGQLQYAVSGRIYRKGGADSPENFLAYEGFDNTLKNPAAKQQKRKQPLHRYEPHVVDWQDGDPLWQDSKGKGIIGALNYLASKRMNSVYFVTMNVTGDGDDVWPWIAPDERDRFDCSKLAQWNLVFDHMDKLGIALQVITQETENDHLLDGGQLGRLRKLYYREMIARFAHHQAVVWNLGEECTNTTEAIVSFAEYIKRLDPYDNPIVVHTYPQQKEKVYEPLLGNRWLDGLSLQFDGNDWHTIDEVVGGWVRRSAQAGKPWFVCVDEPGTPERGVDHDARADNNQTQARKTALWAALFAGGSGVEWYFGYKNPHNDLNCEDWRSRDQLWEKTAHALEFFRQHLPKPNLTRHDNLVQGSDAMCLESGDHLIAIYAADGGPISVDLSEKQAGEYKVHWFNPRTGETVQSDIKVVSASEKVDLGPPPQEPDQDWAVVMRRVAAQTTPAQGGNAGSNIFIEAECYARQRLNTVRNWYLTDSSSLNRAYKDADEPHTNGASGGAYLEILPDTRQTHADKLVQGISFSNEPGKVGILDYPVYFAEPGKYYVWVRAYSTGSEDNGLHVGLDGKWPESGRRLQWCQGKNTWRWESRQRTAANHCGEPGKIFLEVKDAGLHTVSFSMREDGFEFDSFLLTRDRNFSPRQ
ncbi:MAG: DUF5060 domain-containing protein [Planctomycetota bacterium]